jgi:hypothetical protein
VSADNQDFPDSGDDGRDRTWIAVHAASAVLSGGKYITGNQAYDAAKLLLEIAEAHAKPEAPKIQQVAEEPSSADYARLAASPRYRLGDWIVHHGRPEEGALLVLNNTPPGWEKVDVYKLGAVSTSLCRRATESEIAIARGEKG